MVHDFASQVRALCTRLIANPFNTPAAEMLLDLLEDAPTADLALERVMQVVVYEPVPNGVQLLDALVGGRRYTAPNTAFVAGAAA
ncbi:hypothetical protein ACOJVP_07195 [Mycobacterium sp. THU-M116]